MPKYFLLIICLVQMSCTQVQQKRKNDISEDNISITSSNRELVATFNWAVEKARSFVQTGKKGPVNISGESKEEDDSVEVTYIPSYWAGYPLRTAFYSRDFCHQTAGAHLLGLEKENFTMLKAFAASADEGKKWFPLWAINFDGSIYTLDYHDDNDFVREIPAVFELVEKAYQLYLWTGDKKYYQDEVLWNYYTKVVTDFIRSHDRRMPNGVPEGSGAGIFQGTATYNEQHDLPLLETGDDIASEYKAFWSYAKLAALKGEEELARRFFRQADSLKNYFNHEWGVKNTDLYNRGYSMELRPVDGWGKENSWFMPMKGITDANSDRNLRYLDFIEEKLENKEDMPVNIEAISYIPELYFQYHQNERGWQWMSYIMSHINTKHAAAALTGRNGNYPEVSYVLLSNVVEGLLGVIPDAANNEVSTFSHLTKDVPELCVSNIRMGTSMIEVEHQSNHISRLRYQQGEKKLRWKVCFPGHCSFLYVDGKQGVCQQGIDNGQDYSFLIIELSPGEEKTVEAVR